MTLNTPEIKAYSIPTFCSTYSIGRSLAYKEIKKGTLKVVKVGKRTLIPIQAAESWLNDKMAGG